MQYRYTSGYNTKCKRKLVNVKICWCSYYKTIGTHTYGRVKLNTKQ